MSRSTDDPWLLLPVSVRSRFTLLNALTRKRGHGQGHAFHCKEITSSEHVVIKMYKTSDRNSNSTSLRIVREKLALIRLNDIIHDNSIPIFKDSNVESFKSLLTMTDSAYIVTDYVNHQTLADCMNGHPNGVSFNEAVDFTDELLNILRDVHDANIRPRDIKPNNIILTTSNRIEKPMLIDFGLASFNDEASKDPSDELYDHFDTLFHEGFSNHFYQHPVMSPASNVLDQELRRSPQVDLTQTCAIFLFLLTGVLPREPFAHRNNKVIVSRLSSKFGFNAVLLKQINSFLDAGLNSNISRVFDTVEFMLEELAILRQIFDDSETSIEELNEAIRNTSLESAAKRKQNRENSSITVRCQAAIRKLKEDLKAIGYGYSFDDSSAKSTDPVSEQQDLLLHKCILSSGDKVKI